MTTQGAFHVVKISGISGSAVNGTRFVSSSHWKIPRKSGKAKKVGPFSRLEFPNGMSCSIYVSRSLYQFQVHGRAPRRTGVYDRINGTTFYPSEIPLLLPPKFPGFFPKWKAPTMTLNENSDIEVEIWISRWPRCINGWTGYFVFFNSIDIFTESILVSLSLFYTVMRIGMLHFYSDPLPSLG